MANVVRELPEEEWPRLMELGDPNLKELPDRGGRVRIFVEEEDQEIIGYWMVAAVVHIEPCWVRPDKRGGFVVHRLWGAVRGFLDSCRIPQAFCLTEQAPVANYLTRLGLQELPEKTFLYER